MSLDQRGRPWIVKVALLTIAAVMLLGGLVGAYVRDTVLDTNEFVERGVGTLDDEVVREELAAAAVDSLIAGTPDLNSVRPLLIAATEFAIDTELVKDITRVGLGEVHVELVGGEADVLSVRMADLLLIVNAQAQVLAPDIAAELPDGLTEELLTISTREQVTTIIEIADGVRALSYLLPLTALVIFGLVIYFDRDRRTAIAEVGAAIASVGALLVVAQALGRSALERATDRDAAVVMWDAFVGDLAVWGLFVFAFGAIVGLGAASLLRPIDVAAIAERARSAITRRPKTRWASVLRVLILTAVGLWLIVDPLAVLGLLAGFAGLILVAGAASHVIRSITVKATEDSALPATRLAGSVTVLVLVVALFGVLGISLVRSIGGASNAEATAGCNGSVLLCDRPLDEVAIAATHNSMSNSADGYLSSNHTAGMVEQLDAGYRGLLIDTAYGFESEFGFTVTDRAPLTPGERDELVAEIGADAVEAAEALQQRQGEIGTERGFYLCHGLCEAGSTPLDGALIEIRGWLDRNPREVVVIFVQDEMSPTDTETAFEDAGLLDFVHTQKLGEPFPTLAEMIRSDGRLFVMAENDPEGVDWYHDGFAFTQETPFRYETIDDFDCEPNRGNVDSPLFQVNHFVTPPVASKAVDANSIEVLWDRLEQCREERDLFPNLVAVDFFAAGDVLEAVDRLNGVTRG